MRKTVAFDPHRFETAAPHYVEGRPPYSERLIRRVVDFAGLNGSQSILDLGTGPGTLALELAPYAAEICAIDPEPQMLRIAGARAAMQGLELNLVLGDSFSLDPSIGTFDLVTIGRAFHWMDREKTLAMLDRIIKPGGGIALLWTRHPTLPENEWHRRYEAILDPYRGPNSVRKTLRSPEWLPHESILLNSRFCWLERIGIIERRLTPLEKLVTRALSFSGTSSAMIAGRETTMAREIRDALSPYANEGMISEVVESEALVAFRPFVEHEREKGDS